MDNFVIVKNVFRADLHKQYISKFTDLHLLVLVYMQRFMTLNTNTMTFTSGWLYDDLNITNDDTKNDIINSLHELVDMNLIELEEVESSINRNTRLEIKLVDDDISFTKVYNPEINKILSLEIDIRTRRTMLFLYVDIVSRIDDKRYCYPSFANFKKDLDTTSDNRINDALELLKDNNLIDYDNVGQVIIDNEVRQANNIYVLCKDNYKEILKVALSNRKKSLESGKAKIVKKEQSNLQRSIKQKINNLVVRFEDETISDDELELLKKLELDYYNLIKNDAMKLVDIDFKTLKFNDRLELFK